MPDCRKSSGAMQGPSLNAERARSIGITSQQQEGQKVPKKSSSTQGRSTASGREPKASRARLQTHQYPSKPLQNHHINFRSFSGPPNPPRGKIDLEKHIVNVCIEITQKSVNTISGSSSPFKPFILGNHKRGQKFLRS